jgi:hypothetical protein
VLMGATYWYMGVEYMASIRIKKENLKRKG